MKELCRECPKCGAALTRATVKTVRGAYCFCDECGHAWHDERPEPEPQPGQPHRRKTDPKEPTGAHHTFEHAGTRVKGLW
jgi:hypothetical protein